LEEGSRKNQFMIFLILILLILLVSISGCANPDLHRLPSSPLEPRGLIVKKKKEVGSYIKCSVCGQYFWTMEPHFTGGKGPEGCLRPRGKK